MSSSQSSTQVVKSLPGNKTSSLSPLELQKKKKASGPIFPNEIFLMIMKNTDPVTACCFGLTSSWMYSFFREKAIEASKGPWKGPDTVAHRLELRVTTDEEWTLNDGSGWERTWHLRDRNNPMLPDPRYQWEKSLGELICGEEKLWKGFWYCWNCGRYKPEKAFETWEWEEGMLRKYEGKVRELFGEEESWDCKRCRARELLVVVEGNEEVWEEWDYDVAFPESYGIRRLRVEGRKALPELDSRPYSWDREHARENHYEMWEEVYEDLGI